MLVTTKNLREVIQKIAKHTEIAIDTETTGLEPFNGDRLFSIIVATDEDSYYFNFNDYEKDLAPELLLPRAETLSLLQTELFYDENRTVVMHNAKFDLHMLYMDGIEVKCRVVDTEVLGRLEYNRHLSYSLANLAKLIGKSKSNAVEEYISKHKLTEKIHIPGKKRRVDKKYFERVPFEIMSKYGMQDGRVTLDLYRSQRQKIAQVSELLSLNRLQRVVENETALTKVCWKMERDGILINPDYCLKALNYEQDRAARAVAEFESITGAPFKDSNKALAEVFTAAGESYPTTRKGNPSFTADVLEGFTSPLAKLLLEYRDATKRGGTYFSSYLYYADDQNRIHPNIRQAGTETGRFSVTDPNCLSLDTEVLTTRGWLKYHEVGPTDKVACFNPVKRSLEFLPYIKKYVSDTDRRVIRAVNKHCDMLMTLNHRCLFRGRKTGDLIEKPAALFHSDAHILHGALFNKEDNLFDTHFKLRLLVAVQADGHFTAGKQIVLSFTKQRKIDRIKWILSSLGIAHKISESPNGRVSLILEKDFSMFRGCLSPEKTFTHNILMLSAEERRIFLEELRYWDGLSTRQPIEYYSKASINVDLVQALASLDGRRARIRSYTNATGGQCLIVNITDRDYSCTTNIEFEDAPEQRVWCLEVETSFFLARRNGKTFITGNCQNLPKEDISEFPIRRSFVPSEDFFYCMIDYDQMEYRLLLDIAGEEEVIRKILHEGLDVHEATAAKMGVSRKAAKTLNFLLLYGGGKAKLAKALGISEVEAGELKRQYFSSLPRVSQMSRDIITTAETRGSIFNWMGRVCFFPYIFDAETQKMSRYAYIAPNHYIQGGCADVVKLAMVRVGAHLEARGARTRMLLNIHDELLFEIHRNEADLIPELVSIMSAAYPYKRLPLTCSAKISEKSWADGVEFKQ